MCRQAGKRSHVAVRSTVDEFPEWFRPRWPRVRQQLLEGTYRPAAARRKAIPEPDSSERLLGIPNVAERLIQQAILQVLTPIFDPDFSESSFGFRPKRLAHGAIKEVQRTIREGYRHCVNMDLSRFFDRIQHDVLLVRVARKVHDKRLLKLIGRYLRAGVLLVDGIVQPSPEGTIQGPVKAGPCPDLLLWRCQPFGNSDTPTGCPGSSRMKPTTSANSI